MKANFKTCTEWLLVHEGGYVNHPKDPGGATNKGVIQRTYDGYRSRKGLSTQSVRSITMQEVLDIYKSQYWDRIFGDALPSGLDYAMYDYAVNSGPSRAVKDLQKLLGVKVDGVMGNVTLGAIKEKNDIEGLITSLCLKRWNWMKTLKTWSTFGKGWTRRVMGDIVDGVQAGHDSGVIDRSVWLFQGVKEIPAPTEAAPGKAEEEDTKATVRAAESINMDNLAKIGGGVVPGAIASASALPDGPLQYAAAAIGIIAALVVAYVVVKKLAK